MVSALRNTQTLHNISVSQWQFIGQNNRDRIRDIAHYLEELMRAKKYISEESGTSQMWSMSTHLETTFYIKISGFILLEQWAVLPTYIAWISLIQWM